MMNRVLALCIKTKNYPSVFAECGYRARLIEGEMNTHAGVDVKPDIIVAAERTPPHIVVFDCKSGHSVNEDQLENYRTLTDDVIRRWVRVHEDPVPHNLCFAFGSLGDSYDRVVELTDPHPLLIFGDQDIKKVRDFNDASLNHAFRSPISLVGSYTPVSYYPFSEMDADSVIRTIVFRKLVLLAYNRQKGDQSVTSETIVLTPEIIESTHPFWKALSVDHRKNLSNKVQNIMKNTIRRYPELREYLVQLEERQGVKVQGSLEHLRKIIEEIIEQHDTSEGLDKYLPKK